MWRVVERQGGRIAEPDDEQELVLGELLEAGAIDVERSLELAPRDQRDDDERLGIRWRVDDEADAGIELGAVREHGLPVLDRPARDPDAERERRIGEHLGRVLPGGVDGLQLAGGLVRLVERDVVARDQLTDRVRDPMEEVVERLLGEQLVEDVRELAVRVDQRIVRGIAGDGRRGSWQGCSAEVSTASFDESARRCSLLESCRDIQADLVRWPEGSSSGSTGRSTPPPRCAGRSPRPSFAEPRSRPIHAWSYVPIAAPPDAGLVSLGWTESAEVLEASGRAAERAAQDELAAVLGADHRVRVSVVQGEPAAALLAAAEDAELLVVGNRGRGSFAQALLGSTSAKVSDRAACPVVVVRGRADG